VKVSLVFKRYRNSGCLVTNLKATAIQMSRSKAKLSARIGSGLVEVKSRVRHTFVQSHDVVIIYRKNILNNKQ